MTECLNVTSQLTGREVMWALCVQRAAPVIFLVFFIVPRDFFFFKCRDHLPSLMSLGAAVVPCRGSACLMAPFRAPSARGVVCGRRV